MKKIKAFTLIETIIVIAVIGLTLPVIFAIIFTLMRQQVKIYRLSQVKREGDYIINLMENNIRDNAVSIHSASPATDANIVCSLAGDSQAGPPLYFLDKAGGWFGYDFNAVTGVLSSVNPDAALTSSKIVVTNFSISCNKNELYSPPYVNFDFDICYDIGSVTCTSNRPEETSLIHYQGRIKLRNY